MAKTLVLKKDEKRKLVENVKRKSLLKKTIESNLDYNILAIDPATNCGWALEVDGKLTFGCWSFKVRNGTSPGMKWVHFENMFIETIKIYNINLVAFELPAATMHAGATIHHSKMNGIMEKVCASMEIEYLSFATSEIKKFATGKGNAKKDEMIKAAKDSLGYEGDNDNEADALWILNLAKSNLIKNSKID
jgi:Holliday junction resolvasome RuvABC endonuclease subunit